MIALYIYIVPFKWIDSIDVRIIWFVVVIWSCIDIDVDKVGCGRLHSCHRYVYIDIYIYREREIDIISCITKVIWSLLGNSTYYTLYGSRALTQQCNISGWHLIVNTLFLWLGPMKSNIWVPLFGWIKLKIWSPLFFLQYDYYN